MEPPNPPEVRDSCDSFAVTITVSSRGPNSLKINICLLSRTFQTGPESESGPLWILKTAGRDRLRAILAKAANRGGLVFENLEDSI